MSHFTTVQTEIKDLVRLQVVLKELGYAFTVAEEHQEVHVRGYLGQKAKAKIVIHASKTYDIGIQIVNGNAVFVADWWGVETTLGVTQEEFTRKVVQRYAYHTVKEEVTKRGYTLEEETVDEKQQIHVKVTSWNE